MNLEIRRATAEDEAPLQAIDTEAFTVANSPGTPPEPGDPFFSERTRPEQVLVAVADGEGATTLTAVTPVYDEPTVISNVGPKPLTGTSFAPGSDAATVLTDSLQRSS